MNAHAEIIDPFVQDRFDNEVQLLGSLLAYGGPVAISAARAIVQTEHFHDAFNARLFELIGDAANAGLSAFKLSHWVIGQLRNDDALTEMATTASAILARYIANAAPAIAIEGCARQVKHDCLRVELQQAAEDMDTESAETIAAEMERLSRAHLVKDEGIETIAVTSTAVLNRINDAFMNGAPPRDFAWPGSHDIARVIGGWRRGRFYVLAGRPGMGKSTTALSWLLRTAGKGHGVLFFSLEMGRDELTEMALCDIAWTHNTRIEYRDINASSVMREGFEGKFYAVNQASSMLNSMPFLIGDRGGMTIAEMRSQALQYAQRLATNGQRLDVICIDHLNLIRGSDRYSGSKTAETEEVSMALKVLSKELQCAVIALCQLNRGVEGRDDKRPSLSDLRWSGAIEQDADVVMFVYREAYYLERKKHDDVEQEEARTQKLEKATHTLEIIFAKHRGGPCPIVEAYCDMGCAVVRDREHQHV